MAQDIKEFLPDGLEDRLRVITELLRDSVLALNEQAKAAKEASTALGNSRNLLDLARAQTEAAKAQRELARAQAELQRAQESANRQATESQRTATEAARTAREQARADTERARAAEIANRQAIASTREAERQAAAAQRTANATNRQSSAYLQLSAAYNRAARAAQDLAVQNGLQDAATVQAVAHARQLHDQLLSIDQAVGQSRRNVGNYASGFSAIGNAVNQIGRELPAFTNSIQTGFLAISNNLPALGDALRGIVRQNAELRAQGQPTVSAFRQLAASIFSWQTALSVGVTLLTLYGKDIVQWAASIFGASSAVDKLKQNQENLNATMRTAYKETGAEIATLDRLYRAATDVTLSIQQRKVAVDRLQEDYPSYFKNLTDEAILNDQARDSYDELRNAIILAGRARAIRKATDEFAEKDLEIEQKMNEAFEQRRKLVASIEAAQRNRSGASSIERPGGGTFSTIEQVNEEMRGLNELLQQRADNRRDLKRTYNFYITEAERLEKATSKLQNDRDARTLKTPGRGPRATDYTNETLNASERVFQAQSALTKQRLQQDIETQKAIFENESNSLDDRIAAYQKFVTDRLAQVDAERKGELYSVQANLDKITEIEKKADKDRTKEEKALVIQKEAFEAEKTAAVEKFAAQEKAINEGIQGDITKLIQSEAKRRTAILSTDLAKSKELLNRELQDRKVALANQYGAGEISETTYRQRLEDLQDEYDRKQLTDARDQTAALIAELEKRGFDARELRKQLAEADKALATETADHEIKEQERIAKARQTYNEKVKQIAKQAATTLVDIVKGQFAREEQGLQRQAQQVDLNKEKEILAVRQTTLSQEEKDQKIAEIESRALSRREDIASKQRALQRRQAVFERSVTISQIIAETALAAVRALGDKSLPGPARIPLAIAISALGALQVASVLAQPLPAYAEGAGIDGKPLHPGGKARVGENNRPEIVLEPGRSPYRVKGDQVRNLAVGAAVIPEHRLEEMGYAMLSNGVIASVGRSTRKSDNADVIAQLNYWGSRHEKAMKRGANVSLIVHGDNKDYYRKRTTYGHS